jgi:hypothetical protein
VLERLSVLHRTELRTTGPALVQALQALIGTSLGAEEKENDA